MRMTFALGGLGALLVVAHAAHAQPAASPVKIGVVMPYSGQFADTAIQMDHAIKLYMKQHGDSVAGRRIELIRRDTGGVAPDVAKRLAQELVERGSLAVLGRNGVGKSTLLLTIMGHADVGLGAIRWHGEDITRLAPHRRALRGLGWVPQEREIFPSLTVEENLVAAARRGRWTPAAAYSLFPLLAERRRHRGHQLSGGEQQMLAIARALMTNPALLLLDEPLEGLAPIVVRELTHAIGHMTAREGTALILVERHAEIALSVTDHALVLELGRVVHRGPSRELLRDAATLDRLVGLRLTSGANVPEGSSDL